ncbi:MAG: cupin domain-containing protein [Xanthomonadales bacterium]|nr:cupin domain-containing protein [Xanthomonadales bacterium]
MHPRAESLIRQLALEPHVEGGRYRRIYESTMQTPFGRDSRPRAVATSIYYLLSAGETSRWHRVDADELWHWYEGDALEVLRFDPRDDSLVRHRLGPVTHDAAPVFVVPAGCWQSARPLGDYTLVGCTVAPGYEWRGFTTLDDEPAIGLRLRALETGLPG